MDFDDMPDSYFAFLASQKKVVRPEKIQSIIDEFASSDEDKSKIRSRVGSQNPSAVGLPSSGSLPTVPSLPSISRTPATRGGLVSEISSPGMTRPGASNAAGGAAGKAGGPLVYALVGVLFVAIVVLGGILLFTK
jgi:hypothetical protein